MAVKTQTYSITIVNSSTCPKVTQTCNPSYTTDGAKGMVSNISIMAGGSENCCSTTGTCLQASGCPYVFKTITWKSNCADSEGNTYYLKSTTGGAGATYATATYAYEEPDKKTYVLTITYSGYTKSNETYYIEEGTTVDPSNYGSISYIDQNTYYITGRSPSSSFKMSEDTTITINCSKRASLYAPSLTQPSVTDSSFSIAVTNSQDVDDVTLYASAGTLGSSTLGSYSMTSCSGSWSTYGIDRGESLTVSFYFKKTGYITSSTVSHTFTRPSIKKYSLLLIYVDTTTSKEIKREYASDTFSLGDKVTPSNYGTAPDGYTITGRDPSYYFYFEEGDNITIKCEPASQTTYPLYAKYTYSGSTLSTAAIDTGITDGTLINVSNDYLYGAIANNMPTGYTRSSYSPSFFNFKHDSADTITITCSRDTSNYAWINIYSVDSDSSSTLNTTEKGPYPANDIIDPAIFYNNPPYTPSGYNPINYSPTASTAAKNLSSVTIYWEKITQLKKPELVDIDVNYDNISFKIKNPNSISVDIYVYNKFTTNTSKYYTTNALTYDWGGALITSKNMEFYFKDPNSVYLQSNVLSYTFERPEKIGKPVIELTTWTQTSCNFIIRNNNDYSVKFVGTFTKYKYSSPSYREQISADIGTIVAANGNFTLDYNWEDNFTLIEIKGYFTDLNSVTTNKRGDSDTASVEEQKPFNSPTVELKGNNSSYFTINITNPNNEDGTLYLLDNLTNTSVGLGTLLGNSTIERSEVWEERSKINYSFYLVRIIDGYTSTSSSLELDNSFVQPELGLREREETLANFYIANNNTKDGDYTCYYIINPTIVPTKAIDIINNSNSVRINNFSSLQIFTASPWNSSNMINIYSCFTRVTSSSSSVEYSSVASLEIEALMLVVNYYKDGTLFNTKNIIKGQNTNFTLSEYKDTITGYNYSNFTLDGESTDKESFSMDGESHILSLYYTNENAGKYDLTINEYRDGSPYGLSRTESITAGDEVIISKYISDYSGYAFDYSDPSGESFTMPASAKTLNIYYVSAPQLTIEYYKNEEIDSSLTKTKAFKSTEPVGIEEFKISIEGYNFDSSDPEKDFTMGTSNRTLKMYYVSKSQLNPPTAESTPSTDFTLEEYKFKIINPNESSCNLYVDNIITPWGYNISKQGYRYYSNKWQEEEYSKTLKLYAGPITSETEKYSMSEPFEYTVKRLQKPIITYKEDDITYNSYKISITNNSNNPSVKYSVNDVVQTGSISSNSTVTYSRDWESTTTGGSTKEIKVKFYTTKDYGPTENAIEIKRPEELKAPEITLISTYSNYTVKIHNPNKTISPKYNIYKNSQVTPLSSGTILKTEDSSYADIEYVGTWEETEKPDTEITIKVEFTATPKYTEAKSASDTIERPEQGQLSKPNLQIVDNENTYFTIKVTNPNNIAVYTNSTTDNDLNSISIPALGSITKQIFWQSGINTRVVGVSLKTTGEDGNYKESGQTEITVDKGIIAPILNVLSNNYTNCIIDIINSNSFEVEFVGTILDKTTETITNISQNLSGNQELLYPILWNDYTSTELTLTGKFIGEEGSSSEVNITLNRPVGLEQPLLEQTFNSGNYLSFSITNRNSGAVYPYIDGCVWLSGYDSGTPVKMEKNTTSTYTLSQKVPDNTKYEVFFQSVNQGLRSDISSIVLSTDSPSINLKPELILEKNTQDEYTVRIINWNLFSVTAHILKKDKEVATQTISGLNSSTLLYNWEKTEESFNYSVYFTKDNYKKSLTSRLLIPKINYYNLTIQYFGVEKDEEIYGPFKEGTLIDPLDYGTVEQGYVISTRSISEEFSLLSDTTIIITEIPILKAPIIEKKDNEVTYCSYQITNSNNVKCTFVGTLKGYHYLGNTILLKNITIDLDASGKVIFPVLWERGITYDTIELSGYLEGTNYGDSPSGEQVKITKKINKPVVVIDPQDTTAKEFMLVITNNNPDSVDLYSENNQMVVGGIQAYGTGYYIGTWKNSSFKKVYFKRVSDGYDSEEVALNLATPATLSKPNIIGESDLNSATATFTISNPNNVDTNFVFDIRNNTNETIITGSMVITALKTGTYTFSWDSVSGASSVSLGGYLEQIHAIYNASEYTSTSVQKKTLNNLQNPELSLPISTREKLSITIKNPNTEEVDLYINNILQTKTIAAGDNFTYERTWGDEETDRTVQVYFHNKNYICPWSTIINQTFDRPAGMIVTVDTLLNTKWALNKTVSTGSIHTSFAINGVCDSYSFTAIKIGYNGDTSAANYISLTTSTGTMNIVENGLPLYKQISFTTGTDVENTNLISWMNDNAIKLFTVYDLSQLLTVSGDYEVSIKAIASNYTDSNSTQSLDYAPYEISNAKLKDIKASSANAVTLSDGDVTWLEFEAAEGYTLPEESVIKNSKVEGATVNKWIIKDE